MPGPPTHPPTPSKDTLKKNEAGQTIDGEELRSLTLRHPNLGAWCLKLDRTDPLGRRAKRMRKTRKHSPRARARPISASKASRKCVRGLHRFHAPSAVGIFPRDRKLLKFSAQVASPSSPLSSMPPQHRLSARTLCRVSTLVRSRVRKRPWTRAEGARNAGDEAAIHRRRFARGPQRPGAASIDFECLLRPRPLEP